MANAADLVRALGASEHRLFQLLEHVPVGIFVLSADGKESYANQLAREILAREFDPGLKAEDLPAAYQIYVAGTARLYPYEQIPIVRALKGESVRVSDMEIRRSDRTVRLEVSAAPLLDEKGAVTHAVATIEDVTETERISSALRASERAYRYLVENATDVIYSCDNRGYFTYVNPTVRTVVGYTEQDLLRTHFIEVIDPEFRDQVADFYQKQFDTRAPNTYYEFPIRTPAGMRVWIGQNVQALLRGDHVMGFQAVARDISERRKMEEELGRARDDALESARLKSEFLANVSHEIRTPMNGVIGMADLLVAGALTADQRDYAQTIRQSAESLLRIVDDILDLSKMEAGKMTVKSVDFDLDELIDDITDVFAERAAAKGIRFRSIIYPDVQRQLRGDAMRIRQVIVNLVGNAIKFTTEGDVTLSVMQDSQNEDSIVLWFLINDTGIGISPADQERLFTPFVQVDGKTNRKFGGTGLGLAISKQLVALLGGRIGVASVPAEGSTFWFTAPLERGVATSVAPKRTVLAGLRALVVDGDEVNRLVLRRHLSSAAMRVDEATGVADAMEAIRNAALAQPYDVVVVDMQLPRSDGLALTRAIRTEEFDIIARTPVVLITAIGRRKSDVEAFRASGVSTFIIKPVRQSQLAAAVAGVIDRRAQPATDPVRQHKSDEVPVMRLAEGLSSRILVVEDNVINQKVALGQLRHLGYIAEVAGSGHDALRAVGERRYDLVLLDCQMPDMDGYQVAQEMRRLEDGAPRTPIIAMTAHTHEGERDRCLAAGMDDYLTKPVSTARLGETISRYIAAPVPVDGALDVDKVEGLREMGKSNPRFLADITSLFREDALLRLHDLRDAALAGNVETMARAAHALKSSSGNVGAKRIYTICEAIEENARRGSIEGASGFIDQLATELDVAVAALTMSARTGRS